MMCQACGCPAEGNEQVKIHVEGIADAACVEKIQTALLRLPGVYHVHVHAHDGMTAVDYNPGRTSIADMRKALDVAGYQMSVQ
jgi:cation transport ATPase